MELVSNHSKLSGSIIKLLLKDSECADVVAFVMHDCKEILLPVSERCWTEVFWSLSPSALIVLQDPSAQCSTVQA